ncbi:MAG: hypothetical protein ACKOYG_01620 [Ilumatobacteraceae bacterium]
MGRFFGRRELLGGAAVAAGGLLVGAQGAAAARPNATRPAYVDPAVDSGPLFTRLLNTPVRVYDSRSDKLPNGTDPTTGVTDGKWVRLQTKAIDVCYVLGEGRGLLAGGADSGSLVVGSAETGVSASAAGVLMNITVTNIEQSGRLIVWSGDTAVPSTSNMNWIGTTGQLNSLVMSRCAFPGYVTLQLNGATTCKADVIVDVIGWLEYTIA